jgi:hypothetical protein
LHGARRDQHPGALRQAADQRRDAEQRHATDEHAAGADPVTERAAGKQQRGEGKRIGVNHPLQAAYAHRQRGADPVQRNIDDGDIELNHDETEAGRGDGGGIGGTGLENHGVGHTDGYRFFTDTVPSGEASLRQLDRDADHGKIN